MRSRRRAYRGPASALWGGACRLCHSTDVGVTAAPASCSMASTTNRPERPSSIPGRGQRVESSPLKADALSAHPRRAALRGCARAARASYIEEEEGAFNRLGGWIGIAIAAFAVFVSLFHLYAAYEIVPAHVLRPTHVGMVLVLCFLLFPMARRLPRPHPLVGLPAGRGGGRHDALRAVAGRLLRRPRHRADPDGLAGGRWSSSCCCWRARGAPPAGSCRAWPSLYPVRLFGHLPAASLDAPRLCARGPDRAPLHDARRHLRHHGGRGLQPDHSVHGVRRRAAAVGRRHASSSTSRLRPWAAGATRQAARWCSPRS